MADLYLECYSGISGDMTVAALLDLGADQEVLERALASLPLTGFCVKISRVKKSGIDAMDFDVVLEHENHDHDSAYLYGHTHGHREHGAPSHEGMAHGQSGDGSHSHEGMVHGHSGDSAHSHEEAAHGHHGGAPHEHRTLSDIRAIIDGAQLTDGARALTMQIFGILAKAEAKAHGIPAEEVHFHEVGAVDSIVDITAAAVCLDDLRNGPLQIGRVIVPALYEGIGTVRTQHGVLPVPVPAVTHIAMDNEIPMEITGVAGEYVTPTGAAIVAAVRTEAKLPGRFTIKKVGLGAGKRQQEGTGLLRALLIEEPDTVAQ